MDWLFLFFFFGFCLGNIFLPIIIRNLFFDKFSSLSVFCFVRMSQWKSIYNFFIQAKAALKNAPNLKVLWKVKLIIEYFSRSTTFPATQPDALWEINASIFLFPHSRPQ